MAVNIVEQATDLGFHYFSLPCALEERPVLKNVNLLPYKSMLSGNTCPNAASTPHSVILPYCCSPTFALQSASVMVVDLANARAYAPRHSKRVDFG